MVDLQDNPQAILEAKDGEVFMLECLLKLYKQNNYCYLSRLENGEETFTCLGDKKGICLFSPKDMVELIKSKDWVIE